MIEMFGDDWVRVETGVPGAVVGLEDRDGLIYELNGAGSVVGIIHPQGLELWPDETLQERVDRLAAELKEARAELKAAKTQAGGAR